MYLKYILLLVAIILLLIYLRFIIKRILLMIRFMKLEKKKYITVEKKLLFWKLIGLYDENSSDIIIRKNREVFVIKLIGTFRKHYTLVFTEASYIIAKYLVLPVPIYKPEPALKEYIVQFYLDSEIEELKSVVSNTDNTMFSGVYLACPKPLYASDNKKHLHDGDLIHDYRYYTSKGFIDMLKMKP